MTKSLKVDIMLGVFIASLIAANLLGTKITTFFGVAVSVGIFAYPITFLITDIIAETLGRDRSKQFLYAGLVAQILVLAVVLIAIELPANARFELNEEYGKIFGNSARIIIASLTAFLISQSHDIWIFHKLKAKFENRMLWLRNNISTMISQFIDTTLFMFIAFYMVTPKFDAAFIFSLIIPYWIFKVVFAALDTPLIYAGVRWLKRSPETSEKE